MKTSEFLGVAEKGGRGDKDGLVHNFTTLAIENGMRTTTGQRKRDFVYLWAAGAGSSRLTAAIISAAPRPRA
jgi:hypothetical protein